MGRIVMVLEMDSDRVPGIFHTADSCVEQIQGVLDGTVPHYNPSVRLVDCPVVDDELVGVLADLSRMPSDSEVWEQG